MQTSDHHGCQIHTVQRFDNRLLLIELRIIGTMMATNFSFLFAHVFICFNSLKETSSTLGSGRSFLKLGTGVEEFLEGFQIILPRLIGISKILAKITKYMMGCEILGIYF